MRHANKAWDFDDGSGYTDDERLRMMFRAGSTDVEIASKLGRGVRAVACRRASIGLTRRKVSKRGSPLEDYSLEALRTELLRRGYKLVKLPREESAALRHVAETTLGGEAFA